MPLINRTAIFYYAIVPTKSIYRSLTAVKNSIRHRFHPTMVRLRPRSRTCKSSQENQHDHMPELNGAHLDPIFSKQALGLSRYAPHMPAYMWNRVSTSLKNKYFTSSTILNNGSELGCVEANALSNTYRSTALSSTRLEMYDSPKSIRS